MIVISDLEKIQKLERRLLGTGGSTEAKFTPFLRRAPARRCAAGRRRPAPAVGKPREAI